MAADPVDDDVVQRALQIIGGRTPPGRRLCPSCGRSQLPDGEDRCRTCTDELRSRELASKREWWARRGARHATKLERAETWLKSQLRRGPVESRVLYARAAKAEIHERTLRRAAVTLGVDVERRGRGRDHRTTWSL